MSTILRLTFSTLVITMLFSCQSEQQKKGPILESGIYKVAILYPNGEGKSFDLNYYETKHMPMVAGFIGDNLRFYEIDKGIGGRAPGETAPYAAIGYFFIKDVEAYNRVIGENIDAIISDFKNYTNIQPIIQISEIKQVEYNIKK